MEWAGVLQGKYTIVESENNLTTSLVSALCVFVYMCVRVYVCICMYVYVCLCYVCVVCM